MKNYEPELGQALFGQPSQKYKCPDCLETALDAIRDVMAVMKICGSYDWTPFDNSGEKFKNEVFECNAYSWADCWCEAECTCGYVPQLYNFKYKDIEVSWYKYLGRGMSANRSVNPEEVSSLLSECLQSLLNKEKNVQECDATMPSSINTA